MAASCALPGYGRTIWIFRGKHEGARAQRGEVAALRRALAPCAFLLKAGNAERVARFRVLHVTLEDELGWRSWGA